MDLVQAYLPDVNLEQVFHRLAFVTLHQLFVTGFFHADPHPGNIIIRSDNTVAFVDFGIFGELTEDQREILTGIVENTAIGNFDESMRFYVKQVTASGETDLMAFYREGKSVLGRWYQASKNSNSTIQERHLGRYSTEMFELIRRNQLRIDPDNLLFWRTLNALDATGLRFSGYIHLDLLSEMRDFFEQTRPDFVQRVLKLMTDRSRVNTIAELGCEIPNYLTDILNHFVQGNHGEPLGVQESLEEPRFNQTNVRWLTAGIVAISLTILLSANHLAALVRVLIISITVVLFILLVAEVRRR